VDKSRFLYRRGVRAREPVPFTSDTKNTLSKSLRDYTLGLKTAVEFQNTLRMNDITVNSHLAGLIKRSEAGEPISFQRFGKEIFKQAESKDEPDGRFMRSLSPQTNVKVERIQAAIA